VRILIGTEVFYPQVYGGGEVFALNVSRALVKHGHEVHVICPQRSFLDEGTPRTAYEVIDGIQIHRIKGRFDYSASIASLPFLITLTNASRGLIKEYRIDVANPQIFRPCLPLYLASKGLCPCVATFFDIYSSGGCLGLEHWLRIYSLTGLAGWSLEQLILRVPYHRMLTISEAVKSKLLEYQPRGNIDVVYCGVDPTPFPEARKEKVENQLLFLGRLVNYKNVIDAIRAVTIVRKTFPNTTLIIAGSGPLESYIESLSRTHNFIKFLRRPPLSDEDKLRILEESEVLLLPSSDEGFGLVLLEANMAFTPYVAYDIPAIREVTKLTGGGLTTTYKNIDEFAQAIINLLENKDVAFEMAQRGRQASIERFSWDSVARLVQRCFEKAIAAYKAD